MAEAGRRAFIIGVSGDTLSDDEARFIERWRPCGIIIFSRNYKTNIQLCQLTGDVREAAGGENLLVLVDQEGGRVQRLTGSQWPDFPSAAAFAALYQQEGNAGVEALRVATQWLACLLRDVGINANCVPCIDVPVAGAHGIIGDRAYGSDPLTVATLGAAVADGCIAAGVLPIMKHIPGHGRAGVDSHLELPVVDATVADLNSQDFVPFRELNALPAAMSAHVTFTNIDATGPASVSKQVTGKAIREDIGFDGLLISDDVSMQALSGSIGQRASAVIAAGGDVVLHCNGDLVEARCAAMEVPELTGEALIRYERCVAVASREPMRVDEGLALSAIERAREALTIERRSRDRAN